jgi:clan AA aspartic protease (TIGR02281 family)
MNASLMSAKTSLVLVILTTSFALADTIYLKNGRSISGVISGETDDQVVLQLGVGSTTLNKSSIRSIERSAAEENQTIEAKWRRSYATHKKYAPTAFRDLAAEYRTIVEHRNQAVNARNDISRLKKLEKTVRKELAGLDQDIVTVSARLKTFEDVNADNADEYNSVVRESNALHATIVIQRKEIENIRENVVRKNGTISGYITKLTEFQETFSEQATPEVTNDNPDFFDAIEAKLGAFGTEFQTNEIMTERQGFGLMVTALINGRVGGTFLVDTGAGVVTITSAFAAKLGLDLSGIKQVDVVLADGKKARAVPIVLDSVELGEAKAENVDAVVMPSAPGNEVDGLLGMSFLSDFIVNVDAGAGKLVLRRFSP